jgi:sugar phosphate isomerase/epimerase
VLRLACQEQLLPGDTLEAKWEFAVASGYDGIELRGQGAFAFRERLPELRRALRNGVVMPTVCVEMAHFIGAFDEDLRRDAIEQLRSQLTVIAELGGRGAMTPASWGMFSRRLPPFEPPRTAQDDRQVLTEALHTLGAHAAREGVRLYLEPLNRYEDHMVNRLEQAVDLVVAAGAGDGLGVVADTFHMNIEEDDPAAALRAAAAHLGHVQVSDSNRFQPGAGHLDWPAVLGALDSVDYGGYLAVECRLRGDPAAAVASIPAYLRRLA